MQVAYQPPYTITSKIVNLVAEISESIGHISAITDHDKILQLRRINRIKTIQGSLAIEGNSLQENQITAILHGKHVLAPTREIQEVRNAIEAYEKFEQWNPSSETSLLDAHGILTKGLIDEIGIYRKGGVGVVSGNKVIHVAPPASRVPDLMKNLLRWLGKNSEHPLITSSVFHYEFEFIHPFADGNGRMGRLWQSLILYQWNPILAYIPVESLVYKNQSQYYNAIQNSTNNTDSSIFIEFILSMLQAAILHFTPQEKPQVTPQVEKLIVSIINGDFSRDEIQKLLALKDRKSFTDRYLNPALSNGLIEMTIPEKPNSKLQKYRLTKKGSRIANQLSQMS